MTRLILEASTESSIVALCSEEKVLYEKQLPFGYQSSKHLVPVISQLLDEAGVKVEDLRSITTGVGPGSYTGIRVGVIVAEALALPYEIELIGISSLTGFIPENHEGEFAGVIDARSGGVYLQLGEMRSGKIVKQEFPQILPLEKAVEVLGPVPVLVTPNATRVKDVLEGFPPNHAWRWEQRYPSAKYLAQIEGTPCKQLEPLYLKKTQAEENLSV